MEDIFTIVTFLSRMSLGAKGIMYYGKNVGNARLICLLLIVQFQFKIFYKTMLDMPWGGGVGGINRTESVTIVCFEQVSKMN